MGFLSNIYNTVKSAFTPAPEPTNILTPEAQARISNPTTPAAQRIAASTPTPTAPLINLSNFSPRTPAPTPAPIIPLTPMSTARVNSILTPEAIARTTVGSATESPAARRIAAQPKTPAAPNAVQSLTEGIKGLTSDIRTVTGEIPVVGPLTRLGETAINKTAPVVGKSLLTGGLLAAGSALGLASLPFYGSKYAGPYLSEAAKDAFKNIGFIWSKSDTEALKNDVSNVSVSGPDIKDDGSGPVEGTTIAEDPNTGDKRVVQDGETAGGFQGKTNARVAQTLVDIENNRKAAEENLIQQQNENAIKGVAEFLGMDEASVRELVESDPKVRILYDELFKKAKAAQDAQHYKLDNEEVKTVVTSTPPPTGFNALEVLKSLMDAAGIPAINKIIAELEEDSAGVKNIYQQRHDEIKNNPEYPQWLKARRDEFVTTAEDRALALYENKLKALREQKTNAEKLVGQYYDATVKQYELEQQAKRDALDSADKIADNDRELLADYMEVFAEQGTNWADLSPEQQFNISRQFTDPGAVEALGTFDFKSTYDNAVALDWARTRNSAASAASKPTTVQIGDTVYEQRYNADGTVTRTPLGRAGSPTVAQTRQDLLEWMAANRGVFTSSQLEDVARSINPELAEDSGITNAIDNYAAQKEGGFLGFGGSYTGTLSQEDPITSFSNYQGSKAFTGGNANVPADTGGVKVGDIVTYEGVQYKVTGFDADGTIIGDPI